MLSLEAQGPGSTSGWENGMAAGACYDMLSQKMGTEDWIDQATIGWLQMVSWDDRQ